MNGAHDMGGIIGFGPVVPEKDEPVFWGRVTSRSEMNPHRYEQEKFAIAERAAPLSGFRASAIYVDKILRSAKSAALPVEQARGTFDQWRAA
jgi:hypothetical protein